MTQQEILAQFDPFLSTLPPRVKLAMTLFLLEAFDPGSICLDNGYYLTAEQAKALKKLVDSPAFGQTLGEPDPAVFERVWGEFVAFANLMPDDQRAN